MDFFELIHARRSVRAYTSQPVEEEKITRLLEAANHAPSAGNLQAYVIVVVRDPGTKAALARAALNQDSLTSAPIVLAFFAHQQASAAKYKHRGVELYSVQDATVACAYAQLAATALGLGTVWVGAFDDTSVKQVLKAQPDWRARGAAPGGLSGGKPRCHTPSHAVRERAGSREEYPGLRRWSAANSIFLRTPAPIRRRLRTKETLLWRLRREGGRETGEAKAFCRRLLRLQTRLLLRRIPASPHRPVPTVHRRGREPRHRPQPRRRPPSRPSWRAPWGHCFSGRVNSG